MTDDDQAVVLHHPGLAAGLSSRNLQPLSRACHRGDHALCEHHKAGGPHVCECSCHLSTERKAA